MNYNKNLQGFIFIIIHHCKYIIIANLSILWLCPLCPLKWTQWTSIVSIGHVHWTSIGCPLCPLCPFTKMDTNDKNRKLWMDTMDVEFVHWTCPLCPSTCPLDMSNGQILSIVSIGQNSQTYMHFYQFVGNESQSWYVLLRPRWNFIPHDKKGLGNNNNIMSHGVGTTVSVAYIAEWKNVWPTSGSVHQQLLFHYIYTRFGYTEFGVRSV